MALKRLLTADRGPRPIFAIAVLIGVGALLAVLAGCDGRRGKTPSSADPRQDESIWREELFQYALDNLNRLEQFQTGAMLDQIVERLDSWVRAQAPLSSWHVDPLVQQLSPELRQLRQLQGLSTQSVNEEDGEALREAVWCRDAANWIVGTETGELPRALRLFDWTIRNIQLVSEDEIDKLPGKRWPALQPWETLLLGQGTIEQRAWVFLLLARQQHLSAAIVSPQRADPKSDQPLPLLLGVRVEKQIYLLDAQRGVPVATPDHELPLKTDGRAWGTLEQAAQDGKTLRRLDLSPDEPYPLRSADLQKVTIHLEASPSYLSHPMRLIEARLVGAQRAVLSVDPSAEAQAWKAARHVAGVTLWSWPYQTLQARNQPDPNAQRLRQTLMVPLDAASGELRKGRLLYLKGQFVGDEGASRFYQQVRASDADLVAGEPRRFEQYYELGKRQRPGRLDEELKRAAQHAARLETLIFIRARQDATLWLGLIAFERRNYRDAADYFGNRKLQETGSSWGRAARYNLGRTLEAAGKPKEAIAAYQAAPASQIESRLRAKWLQDAGSGG